MPFFLLGANRYPILTSVAVNSKTMEMPEVGRLSLRYARCQHEVWAPPSSNQSQKT